MLIQKVYISELKESLFVKKKLLTHQVIKIFLKTQIFEPLNQELTSSKRPII